MRVASLDQKVRRAAQLGRGRPHPTARPHAEVFLDHLGVFGNDARFIVLPHSVAKVGIGAAVRADGVAASFDAVDHIRVMLAHEAVEQDCRRNLHFIQHVEHCDAEAVVAPREIALRLRPDVRVNGSLPIPAMKAKCSMFRPM